MRRYYCIDLNELNDEIERKRRLSFTMRERICEIERTMDKLTVSKYSGTDADALRAGMKKMTSQVLTNQVELVNRTADILNNLYGNYAECKSLCNKLGVV